MMVQIDHLGTLAGYKGGKSIMTTAEGHPITNYYAFKDLTKEFVMVDGSISVFYYETKVPESKG